LLSRSTTSGSAMQMARSCSIGSFFVAIAGTVAALGE
jgi:hypothetical protein